MKATLPDAPFLAAFRTPDLGALGDAIERGTYANRSVVGLVFPQRGDAPLDLARKLREASEAAHQRLALTAGHAAIAVPFPTHVYCGHVAGFVEQAVTLGFPVVGWVDGWEAARAVERAGNAQAVIWHVLVDVRALTAALS